MLISNLDLLATAPGGVARLRELILTLAVQGKLVRQDPSDEPASELLKKIRVEKDRLIAEGQIKMGKPLAELTQEEKPFSIPSSWDWARLGDLCSYIQRGKGPAYAEQSEHRVVSQKCVRWYGLDLEPARFVTPESLTQYEPIRFLRSGDLLWNSTGTGTIGRACLVPAAQDGVGLVADSHVTVVRPVQLNGDFLWRWVQSPYVQCEIEGSASGTTNQIELNTSTVINQVVPVPPLAEQFRIVTRVDELMRLCDALEAKGQLEALQHAHLVSTLLGTLTDSEAPEELAASWQRIATHFDLLLDRPEAVDALEQTILQLAVRGLLVPQDPLDEPASELLKQIRAEKERLIANGKIKRDKPQPEIKEEEKPFDLPIGWAWVRVGQVSGRVQYGITASADHACSEPKFVRITDIQNDQVNWETVPGMQGVTQDVSDHYLEAGDLLIARTGGTIGKSFLVVTVPINAVFASYLIRISPLAGLNSSYLKIFASSEHYWRQLYAKSMGTGQPNVNGTALSELTLPLPPLAEQSRIFTRVSQLRSLCADLRQRLTSSRERQSQLAQALVEQQSDLRQSSSSLFP